MIEIVALLIVKHLCRPRHLTDARSLRQHPWPSSLVEAFFAVSLDRCLRAGVRLRISPYCFALR